MPRTTAPELTELLRQLDAIDLACSEARWDDAERLFDQYDAAVRRTQLASWNATDLNQLIQRQQTLEARMRADRDSAAAELGQISTQRRGVQAYRD